MAKVVLSARYFRLNSFTVKHILSTHVGRRVAKGGTRGTVFKAVAYERLKDAHVLIEKARLGGAAYLAGYALECILKWAATQRAGRPYLTRDLETHDLDILMARAGLNKSLKREGRLQGVYTMLADRWSPELRYVSKEPSKAETQHLYDGVVELYDWVQEQVL